MTGAEMQAEFRLMIDKGDSFDVPSFLESEIDTFLSIAQDKFITKRAFGNNVRKTVFEEDQKRRDDLRTLITSALPTINETGGINNKPNGAFALLPEDYRHSINEEAEIYTIGDSGNTRRVSVKPITHDRYNKIIDDPFNKPEKNTVYRLGFGSQSGQAVSNRVELICGEGQAVSIYFLRYLKHAPDIVSFGDGVQNCILPDHTHREIVRMAVVEALENIEQPRYQSSKIELNEIE